MSQQDAASPVSLSEMIWSHPKIFTAYISRLVTNIKFGNTVFDQFETGNDLYDADLIKIDYRKYIAQWIVSIAVSDDTSYDNHCDFLIDGTKCTYKDPFDSFLRMYSQTEVEDGEWHLWAANAHKRAVHAWAEAYTEMKFLLRSEELLAYGRFQSALAELTVIPFYLWPDDAHSPAIDYENGRLLLPTKEEFFFVQLSVPSESRKSLAQPSKTPGETAKKALVLCALEGLGWRLKLPIEITAKARNNSIHKWLRDNNCPTVSDNLIIQVIRENRLKQ